MHVLYEVWNMSTKTYNLTIKNLVTDTKIKFYIIFPDILNCRDTFIKNTKVFRHDLKQTWFGSVLFNTYVYVNLPNDR